MATRGGGDDRNRRDVAPIRGVTGGGRKRKGDAPSSYIGGATGANLL